VTRCLSCDQLDECDCDKLSLERKPNLVNHIITSLRLIGKHDELLIKAACEVTGEPGPFTLVSDPIVPHDHALVVDSKGHVTVMLIE
jgi:hypothetical protein